MKTKKFKIVPSLSNIEWVGRKVTGSHFGNIDLKNGYLILDHDLLVGGTFIADTTSIKIQDITDPTTNAQFAGHLASDDFFSIDKYPEAVLEFATVTGNKAEGNLTIKGITHPLHFNADINISGDVLKFSSKVLVNRTRYDMKFRSGNFFQNLGDTLIYDDFELNVNITAKFSEVTVLA
jgi:polyisoprenoid-binding protein YceI